MFSNILITISYLSIPFTLVSIVKKRGDIPFDWLFFLFAGFIVFCGIGHAMDVWTLWFPNYWVSGFIRAATAGISAITACTLATLVPNILQIPSVTQLQTEINERNQIEITNKLLEEQNQELGRYAYVISHDLKAPLRAIANLTEWLQEDLEDKLDDDTRYQMKLLKGRVSRMEALIKGLLHYSRVGRIKHEQEIVDFNLLVDGIKTDLAQDGFEIVVNTPLPLALAEKVPMEQIFTNIISNAISHHDKSQGLITIDYHRNDNCHVFSISDDGPGIPEEYHHKVFEIFQTLEARDVKESTGIGLAIVKKIVENTGGQITLKENSPRGLTFQFSLCYNEKD